MAIQPKEVVFLLCDRVKREAGTAKAIIDGVFDHVQVRQFPGGLTCCLFIRAYIDSTEVTETKLRISLIRPNGMIETMPESWFSFANGKIELEVNLEGMPLLHVGRHVFVLYLGTVEVSRVRFEVVSTTAPMETHHAGSEAN
jgi:hypothetical protein